MNETVPFHRQCSHERISRRPRRFHCRGARSWRQSRATGRRPGIAGNAGIALGPFVAATLLIFLEWSVVAALLAVPGVLAVLYGLGAEFDPTAAVADDADAGPDEALSPADLLGNSRTLFAGAFAVVFALVTFEGLYYRGTLTYLPEILHGLAAIEALALPAGLGDPAGRLHLRRAAGRRHGGQYAGGKLTNRVPPARGLAAIFAVLAVLALAFVPVTTMDAGLGVTVALCGVLGFFLFAIQPFYRRSRPSASGLDPEAVHQNAAGDLHAPGRPRALLRLHVPRQVRNRLAEHRRRWGRPR